MAKEYIEREAAVSVCANQYKECLRKNDWCGDSVAWNIGFGIKALPVADVVEVVHGAWVDYMVRDWRCSVCGEKIAKFRNVDGYCYDDKPNYCPNCGARMDGKGE